jgi:hypothetical protein
VVTAGTETRTVAENETYSVVPEVPVFAARNYISPNDPAYHQSHVHKGCALGKDPKDSGRFQRIAGRGGCPGRNQVLDEVACERGKPV